MNMSKFWRSRPLCWSMGLILAASLVSCNRAARTPEVAPSPEVTASPTEPASPSQDLNATSEPDTQTAAVYWLDAKANTIELVPAPVEMETKEAETSQQSLEVAFEQLVSGPQSNNFVSEIPEGTQLLGVTERENGVYVNLSEEFQFGGGSMSMTGRLAQVIYTATSINPDTQVWLEIDGNLLDVLGGEGLILDQPMTRSSFEADFPL